MLKFQIDKEEDIPAHAKSEYKQVGNVWILDVEGAVPEQQLKDFRTNNINLIKERDDLITKFKDVDPEQYKTLKTRAELLDEKKLVTSEGLEAAVNARIEKMKTEYEKQVNDLTTVSTKQKGELAKLKIDTALVTVGTKNGLRPEAVEDFVNRGTRLFSLSDEGQVVSKDENGQVRYGALGQPLTIEEWVGTVAKDKSYGHLFSPSAGGGSTGGATKPVTVNPFLKGTPGFNVTEQFRIGRENPALAAQLKEAAATGQPGPVAGAAT